MASWKDMIPPAEIICEGELEKRSDNLFQLWRKKRGVLTEDRLSLFSVSRNRFKEIRFHSILKVDCVEHTRKYVYFTVVTTSFKEIDFRCTVESCWNAFLSLALIHYKNRRAVEGFRRHRLQPLPQLLPQSMLQPHPHPHPQPQPQPQPATSEAQEESRDEGAVGPW
ncbi:pleckstrin-likey-like domain family A member 2 [Sigmodon hispidus]